MPELILLLIIVIALTSYVGIRNPAYEERYIFDVDRILIDKQYYRLISSGFLHTNWYHLAFNLLLFILLGNIAFPFLVLSIFSCFISAA
ncbi:MAG: hypothetical protein CL843_19380 [Crocinitomicaceae bacterium]|nr:hypothetical protein [Crocinitomicaceae bacterium]